MNRVLNKKAFTLTELIASIVILSILVTLSVVIFMNIRKSALEREYNNLVSYLETKGIEYANSTHITTISVEDLIKEGVIKPDDESDIYDPRDNTSLNCYLIKMEYIDGEYVAKFGENLGENDGKCNNYTKTSDFTICKVDNGTCVDIGKDEWFSNNITLGIKYRDTILGNENVTYSWSTNTGFTSKEKNVTTDVKLIGDITYKCEVTYGEITGVATKNIKIDKEKPVISEVKVDTNWRTSKTIEIIASDGMGSGIKGYFVEGVTSDYQSSNKITVNKSADYKIFVKDNVDNVTDVKVVKVDNIDSGKPTIKRKGDEFQILVGEDYVVLSEYFDVTYSDSGGTTTCNYEKTGSLAVGSHTLTCTSVGGNGEKASDSTTLKVLPRTPSVPTVVAKYNDDAGNTYSGAWTNGNVFLKLTAGLSTDIVTSYQYKISSSGSWSTPSWISMNGNNGSFTYSSEIENTIYIRACNGTDCSASTSGIALKIDKTAPTCSLSISSSRVSMGTKSSDVTKSGVNKSSTPSYTSTYQSIGTGTFYGHVYDKAGNTGTCNLSVTSTSSSSSSYSCSYDCGYWTEPSCSYVCYRYMTASEKAKGKCSGSATEGAYNTCWRWHSSSSCSSSYPYLDSSGTSCSGSSVYVSQTCYKTCYETTYYCPNGYSKLNSSYCYK